MATTSKMLHARIEADLKKDAELIFKKLGLTTTEAIKIYFQRVRTEQGIPFELKAPNKETIETFEKTDRGEDVTTYDSYEDFEAAVKSWANA